MTGGKHYEAHKVCSTCTSGQTVLPSLKALGTFSAGLGLPW